MDGLRTRGQPAAVAAVAAMIRGPVPHAVLVAGPPGVGKTTLALDLAAGLLCTAEVSARPCRTCRGCRLVEHGSHPDLHRVGPAGPGRQVVIGGPGARWRGVRDLISDLALMPVEGGPRVAIIEDAERMNEDAQSALLKTLEEPPAGVTIVLCVDGEERLLPTVRSRCARVRLGLVGPREIEEILADHAVADPPTASRLGRLAGGRPGLALAYARAPEAVLIRAELTHLLLDLTDARPSARLAAARAAVPRAMVLAATLEQAGGGAGPAGQSGGGARAGRKRGTTARALRSAAPPPPSTAQGEADPAGTTDAVTDPDATAGGDDEIGPRAVPATERRRAVELLLGLWLEVARDLVLVRSDGARSVRDMVLLEELAATAAAIAPGSAESFLQRGARAAELLAANVSPELILDSVVLAWPRRAGAAA